MYTRIAGFAMCAKAICDAMKLLSTSRTATWLPVRLAEPSPSNITGITKSQSGKWSSIDAGQLACKDPTMDCIASKALRVQSHEGVTWYLARESDLLFQIAPLHMAKWPFTFLALTTERWTLWYQDLRYTYDIYGMHNKISRRTLKEIRYHPILLLTALTCP